MIKIREPLRRCAGEFSEVVSRKSGRTAEGPPAGSAGAPGRVPGLCLSGCARRRPGRGPGGRSRTAVPLVLLARHQRHSGAGGWPSSRAGPPGHGGHRCPGAARAHPARPARAPAVTRSVRMHGNGARCGNPPARMTPNSPHRRQDGFRHRCPSRKIWPRSSSQSRGASSAARCCRLAARPLVVALLAW